MAVYRDDPYSGFSFTVAISGVSDDGMTVAGAFSEVSGLGVEIAVMEYRNGNEDIGVRKMPGLKKFSNVTLKRGVIGDLRLWNWIKQAMDGQVARADVVIMMLNESREPVLRFRLRRAWPCKWTGPTLSAKNNEVAIELLEICHEGLELNG